MDFGMTPVGVIGAGLAGCEASWQLQRQGIAVTLYEMKPQQYSPAHSMPGMAELVCSNSLRGADLGNAVGLLKEELRRSGSLIMEAADATSVPAGGALAVDRQAFSDYVTDRINRSPLITVVQQECTHIPNHPLIIVATGPLTSPAFADTLAAYVGERLYFYDAVAPIVLSDSLDHQVVYAASRYGKGDGDDYLNCPLDEEQYRRFIEALKSAELVTPHHFEKVVHFEGCMPIEEMAARGDETLRFGPMKPVGLIDPRTGQEPYAVVQLRTENHQKTRYNLVGFQTKMTWPEQRRVLRMIPGLENAVFDRYGVMHRNTFINAPALLTRTLQLVSRPNLMFAGQITGVEGYVESAGSGFLAGCFAAAHHAGTEPTLPPRETALGALISYTSDSDSRWYQPSNITYGMFPPLGVRHRKRERKGLMAERALAALSGWTAGL